MAQEITFSAPWALRLTCGRIRTGRSAGVARRISNHRLLNKKEIKDAQRDARTHLHGETMRRRPLLRQLPPSACLPPVA
jgi:hypothetical protein